MKEIDLVTKAKKGDKDAFQQLIKKEKVKLYRMAFMYVKNEQDALDVFQDTVYKAFTSIHNLKKNKYFSTWITRILINTAFSHIKKNERVIPVNMHELEQMKDTIQPKTAEYLDLHYALNQLEEKYKAVLFLRFYEDYTVEQIASILKCPKGTVKTNLHRGIKILRTLIKEDDYHERGATFF